MSMPLLARPLPVMVPLAGNVSWNRSMPRTPHSGPDVLTAVNLDVVEERRVGVTFSRTEDATPERAHVDDTERHLNVRRVGEIHVRAELHTVCRNHPRDFASLTELLFFHAVGQPFTTVRTYHT
jgi:hypothetical protein